MREIEAEINRRRGEADRRSDIPLTNFRGIELRHFAAEIARLALIIAEFQCDVLYRGQKLALAEFLPLDSGNWITCGNALRLDWLSICPPTGTGVKVHGDDLFSTPLDQAEIDFENEGGETYICGNPPYLGTQTGKPVGAKVRTSQSVFDGTDTKLGNPSTTSAAWFLKAAEYVGTSASQLRFRRHKLNLPRRAGSHSVAADLSTTGSRDLFRTHVVQVVQIWRATMLA